MNSVLIGTHQMDTEFGLYLPEYSIPAPVPQTKFINVIGRDGSVDLSNAFGSVHYNSREWNLDFKHFDPVNWHTISSSVFNAIHGKRLDFTFDDDPNYHWTGRFIVQDYTSKNGCGTLKVKVMADPFKYKNTQTTVSSSVPVNEQTLTGDIVTINNNKAYAVNSLSVSLSPIQSLNGYDSPWPAGGGKNKYSGGDVSFSNELFANVAVDPIPAGTYTVSAVLKVNNDGGARISFRGAGGNNVGYDTLPYSDGVHRTHVTITATETVYKIYFLYGPSGSGSGVQQFEDIQIEAGSTATDYATYSNICPINGRTGVDVYRTGTNVWDEEWELGTIGLSTGAKIDDSNKIRSKNYVPILPNTAYYYKFPGNWRMAYYDADKQLVQTGNTYSPNVVLTSPATARYLLFALDSTTQYNNNISINYPSSDHDYHAYTGTTYALDWSSHGTVYGCTVNVVTGEMTIDRIGIDGGSVEWTKTTGNSYRNFSFTPSPLAKYVASRGTVISSQYKSEANNTAGASDDNYVWIRGSTISNTVCVKDTSKASLSTDDFKTAMTGVQFVWELATPQTVQLTGEQVELLTGTNNVWSDDGQVSVVITEPIVINNPTLPVVPTVTASAEMTLRWNAQSYTMQAGTVVIPQLTLQTGNNPIYVDGTGTISFAFSEASL